MITPSKLELWGGPECTVNRVGDSFGDQFERCGHTHRLDDLDLFAELGIQTIRYPVLWERVAPDHPETCDWSWIDARMSRLRELGISVIAGLVHHGSGPRYTDLLDDRSFATGLAEHARKVAERYPWIDRWTPVNEPLTTARFSALYGHWYPHVADERSFWCALLNQIDGVRLSMAAVRAVNPAAQLIQTEDLGRTFCTAKMQEQADFDNLRRWATWDLLFGKVIPGHPLWEHIVSFGFERRLRAIADDPCAPDIIGVNHYLTSDRFLDHRLERYPPRVHGGNRRQRYADVEAIRVLDPAPPGLEGVLREAWARYRTALAVTEVHNGCTREEQMRWIAEAWDIGLHLREAGMNVRAITIWSLLGSAGWNTLLTRDGIYETGVFDVSSGQPRPTALAALVRGLQEGAPRSLAAQGAGWWRRPTRLLHPVVQWSPPVAGSRQRPLEVSHIPPLLILGAPGPLAHNFARSCERRNLPHILASFDAAEPMETSTIPQLLERHQPWAIINAAGCLRFDGIAKATESPHAAGASGAIRLAGLAAELGIQALSFFIDLDDGHLGGLPAQVDKYLPSGTCGMSEAQNEGGIAPLLDKHLVVRTTALLSPPDLENSAYPAAAAIKADESFPATSDLIVTPTYAPRLVEAVLDLLIDGETGLWDLTVSSDQMLRLARFGR
jgi:dTDP-4-dehydrorhamnose reductase